MLENIVDQMRDEIISKTQEILKIKSVKDIPKRGKPFGEGIDKTLKYALDLSKELGFKTKNFDGYAGHADLGEGEETVGILVHLDVVPEGKDWTYPPYGAEIHDGKIYARGAIDDKGPAIACLYAMKAVEKSGANLQKKVRIIFGTDEESGWGGIHYYFKHEKPPTCAFSPDAEFPVIYGEKGILIFNLAKKFNLSTEGNGIKILKINGGYRANMVPDYCEAVVTANTQDLDQVREQFGKLLRDTGYSMEVLEDEPGRFIIKSYGISAHGSLPEQGKNAISQIMLFLNKLQLQANEISEFISFYVDKIGTQVDGSSIGCGFEDKESGKLAFNVGIIDLTEEKVKLTINIRYPITYNETKVYEGINSVIEAYGIQLEEEEHMAPIYIPIETPLVQKLMKVYQDITGDMRDPITMGGGTYARAMKNAVAFGPLFPGQEEVAHQKNEYIEIEDLIKITKIYAKAIYELAK